MRLYTGIDTVRHIIRYRIAAMTCVMMLAIVGPLGVYAQDPVSVPEDLPAGLHRGNRPVRPKHRSTSPIAALPDSAGVAAGAPAASGDSIGLSAVRPDSIPVDSLAAVVTVGMNKTEETEKKFTFMPDPTRAVWMSALCPGLGQLYNRRYWKLPIVVGAFMGLGYATSWNNTMLRDYTTAYSDIMDNDPTTNSYMDFFAPTVKEEDLDRTWLTNLLRTRKNYFRRNRDLCIICMVGVYLLAMVDAYVDAQLAHFDISPALSMDVAPAVMNNDVYNGTTRPSLGVYWALTF